MSDWIRTRRCRDEEGAALVLALVFLVLIGVLVFYVLGYAQTSISSSSRLDDERRALYAVDSAVNGAIRRVQNSTTLGVFGTESSNPCGFESSGANSVNGKDVQVGCVPDPSSGQELGTSSAPGFAVMTLAQYTNSWDATYNGNSSTYPGCSTISTAANAELGIVQTQDSRQVRITGDVLVNSDVDADLWSNSCPQIYVAQAIQVAGDVTVRESCHDIFATAGNQWLCGDDGTTDQQTQADAGRTPNGAAPAGAIVDPEINNPTSWAPNFTTPPPVQALPTCGSNPVVAFTPGTYNNAAGLSALTNGTNPACAGKLFWFAPGDYYFLFPTGNSQWTIDDANARIVGGTPNAVPTGSHNVGPVTVVAGNPPAATTGSYIGTGSISPTGFSTGTTNALVLGETPTPLLASTGNFTTSNQTRWLTTGGYKIAPPIGDGSSSLQVRARVQHRESWAGASPQLATRQLLVRNTTDSTTKTGAGGVPCVVDVPGSATSGALTDSANILLPAGCLDVGDLNDGTFTLRYQVTHSTCSGGGCQNVSAELDGVQLTVEYVQSDRPAWDPSDASTVTATSPKVPGACVHDGDYGFGPNSGVQWVFGGESRVRLNRGALELCNSFSSTHQEIVLYGVKTPTAIGGTATMRAQTLNNGSPGFTNNLANGRIIDDQRATGQLSSSNPTRSLALTTYQPTVPNNATITAVSMRVRHRESNTGDVQDPVVTITPGGASACGNIGVNDNQSLTTESFNVLSCLDTAAKLNGANIRYAVTRNGNSPTIELDGIELDVTYTTPGQGTGLTPQSGCINVKPYYNRTTHAPGNNGTACAVFAVAPNSQVGSSAPRTVVFWGTVYAPNAAIDVPVNVLTVPVFNRGVVARMLMLGFNLDTSAQVPMSITPITANVARNRRVTFTATTPGSGASVVTDVEFCDIATTGCPVRGGTKIWSWKVTR